MECNLNPVLQVSEKEEGMRLDVFCSSRIRSLSRSKIQILNKKGRITINSRIRPDHFRVAPGDTVRLDISNAFEQPHPPEGQDIPLNIVHEDEHVIVVNKEAGMVVHPAHGNWNGTLVNALLGRGVELSSQGGSFRPGIVHRLDKDTSGLIVVAKSDAAYAELARQLKERVFKKIYHAIVWGSIGADETRITRPLGRHPSKRQKMAVRDGGREAETNVFVIDSFHHFDYIRIVPVTGRTHQIRVHLSDISHPLLGDALYGGWGKKSSVKNTRVKSTLDKLRKMMPRQALHASTIGFYHPVSRDLMKFKTCLPRDMSAALEILFCKDSYKGG